MTNSRLSFPSYSSADTRAWDSVSSSGSTATLPKENESLVGSLPRPVEQPIDPDTPLKRAPAHLDLFNCIPPHAAAQRPRLVYQNSRRDSEDDGTTLIYVRTKDNRSRSLHV
ncbi:hypothetical protein RSAG8_00407, partial [Rhizoctonia solani AG-8 WAC10335]